MNLPPTQTIGVMTSQELLDNFMRRDAEAVENYNNNVPCIEAKLYLIDGRVRDLAALCIFLLKREAAREQEQGR